MGVGASNFLLFGQPKPGLLGDVGISGLGTNPTNPWCQRPRRPPPDLAARANAGKEREPMRQFRVPELAGLFAGFVSLVAGMFLLEEQPLLGVLVILGGMAFVLRSTARFCKASNEN